MVISRSFSLTPWKTENPSAQVVQAAHPPTSVIQSTPTTQVATEAPLHSTAVINTASLPAASEVPQTAALLPQSPADGSIPSLADMLAQNPTDIKAVLQSPEAIHAVMKWGDLKLMGLEHGILNPAGYIRDIMAFAHVETGLPW